MAQNNYIINLKHYSQKELEHRLQCTALKEAQQKLQLIRRNLAQQSFIRLNHLEKLLCGFVYTLNQQIHSLDQRLTTLHKQITQQQLAAQLIIHSIERDMASMNSEKNCHQAQLAQCERDIAIVETLTAEVDYHESRFKQLTESLEILQDDLAVIDCYLKVVSSTGLPLQLLRRFLDEVSQRANVIIIQLGRSWKVCLSADEGEVQISLIDKQGNSYDVVGASASERVLLEIALRSAILDVSGEATPMVVALDEVLDCFDASSIESLPSMLDTLRAKLLLIISHNAHLAALCSHQLDMDELIWSGHQVWNDQVEVLG